MTVFIQYLVNGLGSVYAIIALGYTMVYGIAKMLNFAHGDVIMVAPMSLLRHLMPWPSRLGRGASGHGGLYGSGRCHRGAGLQAAAPAPPWPC